MSINIQFPSNVKKTFETIKGVSSSIREHPILIGGYIRDMIAHGYSEGDLDLVLRFGKTKEFLEALEREGASSIEIFENTGTGHVVLNNVEIEVQSADNPLVHFNIDQELQRLGLDLSWINRNVYERDFTINTIIYDILKEKVLDVTRMGIVDLMQNKMVRCPINPMVSIVNNPIIITRAIKFAIEFGLEIEDEFMEQAPKFGEAFTARIDYRHNRHFLKSYIRETFNMDFQKAYDYYNQIGFLDIIPIGEGLREQIVKKNMGLDYIKPTKKVKKVMDGDNTMNSISFNHNKDKNKVYANFNLRDFSSLHKSAVLDLIQKGIINSRTKIVFLDTPGQVLMPKALFDSGFRKFAVAIDPDLYDRIRGHQEYKQRKRKETKNHTVDLYNVMNQITKEFKKRDNKNDRNKKTETSKNK